MENGGVSCRYYGIAFSGCWWWWTNAFSNRRRIASIRGGEAWTTFSRSGGPGTSSKTSWNSNLTDHGQVTCSGLGKAERIGIL